MQPWQARIFRQVCEQLAQHFGLKVDVIQTYSSLKQQSHGAFLCDVAFLADSAIGPLNGANGARKKSSPQELV